MGQREDGTLMQRSDARCTLRNVTLVDPPYILEQGRVGKSPIAKVGGTGSISTLGLSTEDAEKAEARRKPIGFRAPDVVAQVPGYQLYDVPVSQSLSPYLGPAIDAVLALRAERVERELRDLGECLWTARDTIVVYSQGDFHFVGYPYGP